MVEDQPKRQPSTTSRKAEVYQHRPWVTLFSHNWCGDTETLACHVADAVDGLAEVHWEDVGVGDVQDALAGGAAEVGGH